MLVFILRRLAQAIIVMLTVAFIAFMLFQFVGARVNSLLGQDATQEQRDQMRRDLPASDQPRRRAAWSAPPPRRKAVAKSQLDWHGRHDLTLNSIG